MALNYARNSSGINCEDTVTSTSSFALVSVINLECIFRANGLLVHLLRFF